MGYVFLYKQQILTAQVQIKIFPHTKFDQFGWIVKQCLDEKWQTTDIIPKIIILSSEILNTDMSLINYSYYNKS